MGVLVLMKAKKILMEVVIWLLPQFVGVMDTYMAMIVRPETTEFFFSWIERCAVNNQGFT
jgi:hypothetical protein